jgi:hypothetical protein
MKYKKNLLFEIGWRVKCQLKFHNIYYALLIYVAAPFYEFGVPNCADWSSQDAKQLVCFPFTGFSAF